MSNDLNQAVQEIIEAIDRLAELYATDKDGHFDHNMYLAFKAGFNAGLDAALQIFKPNTTFN
jgi:hypothetical protein